MIGVGPQGPRRQGPSRRALRPLPASSRLISCALRAVALGARRRQRGFIAGALAPQSLKRPLSGRPGGQEGGGGRHRARKGAGARPLLCTQGPDLRLAVEYCWPRHLTALNLNELSALSWHLLLLAPRTGNAGGQGLCWGLTSPLSCCFLNSIYILHINHQDYRFPQMLLCTHYVWQFPSLHLLPGVRRALTGRAYLGLHLSFAIYKVQPGVASPLSVPQSPPL